MTWTAEQRARVGLAAVGAGSADRALAQLVRTEGATAVWTTLVDGSSSSRMSVRARAVDLDLLERRSHECGLSLLDPSSAAWPAQLDDLDLVEVQAMGGAPWVLWAAGDLDLLSAPSVAIVGSRAASQYGEWAAGDFASDLASTRNDRTPHRHVIVSGGAFGIDAAAHRGALAVDGATVAVLAGGLDDYYPRSNTGLLRTVRQRGCVLAEVPPGFPPTRRAFLARNRLIAALSQGTVIVEGAQRSGAQNTVAWALALGRAVAAVPGAISTDRSFTPHALIRAHEATLVTCGDDVRELVAPLSESTALPSMTSTHDQPTLPGDDPDHELDGLAPHLLDVREVLRRRGGTQVDEIVARTGLSVRECLVRLSELEDCGWARLRSDGTWALRRPTG